LILLDTHALLWALGEPRQLSSAARRRVDLERRQGQLLISAISAWEIAMLVRRGRLELRLPAEEWIGHCEALPFLRFVPVHHRIALAAVALPASFPRDPADRIIAATAISLGVELITKDTRLRGQPGLRTVW